MAHHGDIKMLTEVVGQGEVQVCLTTSQEQKEHHLNVPASSGTAIAPGSGAAELGRRLLTAAADGDTVTVRDLISLGAPFVSDWLGMSPLHAAATGGHADVALALVAAGMSRDVRTKTDRTALHMAAREGHAGVVRALLSAGAAVDCRDMLRMTPLHWAAVKGHQEVARVLCAAGACPRAVCRFLCTPLQLAIRKHPENVTLHAILERREAEVVQAETEETKAEPIDVEEIVVDESDGKAAAAENEDEALAKSSERGATDDGNAAALLEAHGITLLPADEGNTVITAIRSGRTVVLSDAGKIMLKESSERSTAQYASVSPQQTSSIQKLTQVKYVQLPKDAKIIPLVSPGRSPARAPPPRNTKSRPIKILLNKNHIGKLVTATDSVKSVRAASDAGTTGRESAASSSTASTRTAACTVTDTSRIRAVDRPTPAGGHVVRVPEQFLQSTDPEYLRKQLLAAHAGLARLKHQLKKLQSNT